MIGAQQVIIILLLFVSSQKADSNQYDLARIDYFESDARKPKEPKSNLLDFTSPTIPIPLVRLLEEPNEINAKAYLRWNDLKQQRIEHVQLLLEKVMHETKN